MAKPKMDGAELDEAIATPVNAEGEEIVAAPAPAAASIATEFQASPEDRDAHSTKRQKMRLLLASQPKVRVRLAEDTYININGHPLRIQGGVRVDVPELVAEILEQAGRI